VNKKSELLTILLTVHSRWTWSSGWDWAGHRAHLAVIRREKVLAPPAPGLAPGLVYRRGKIFGPCGTQARIYRPCGTQGRTRLALRDPGPYPFGLAAPKAVPVWPCGTRAVPVWPCGTRGRTRLGLRDPGRTRLALRDPGSYPLGLAAPNALLAWAYGTQGRTRLAMPIRGYLGWWTGRSYTRRTLEPTREMSVP
jgi:hypothetical protein